MDEKMYGCHSGRIGERPAAVYPPRHPATVDYASGIGVTREYAARAPLIVLAPAAAAGAVALFRRTRPGRRAR